MSWWQVFLLIFLAIPLLVLWVGGLVDMFRRTDLSGPAMALWVVAFLLFPFLGVLAYLVTRPSAPVLRGGATPTAEANERYVATQEAITHDTPGLFGPRSRVPPRAR
jgi:phospholipase D-like protein